MPAPRSSSKLESSMPKTDRIKRRTKAVTQESFELPEITATPLPPELRRPAKAKGPRLVVVYGEQLHEEYTLHEGVNVVGRCGGEPVDIDLSEQEPAHLIWASRQHAAIHVSK